MSRYYIKSKNGNSLKKWLRIFSFLLLISGLMIIGYVFSPFILWQIYFAPVFASQNISSPIPKTTIVNSSTIQGLITNAKNTLSGIDYTDAKNWFPNFAPSNQKGKSTTSFYALSIPAIKIENAIVSTIDTDLASHLVNYQGTSVPPENGNALIFGHSTLLQLFNPKDYKTIFANAYKLNIGDKIYTTVNGVSYLHKIYNITVVDPSDTSEFTQSYDNSYLTLVTCTPPGTTWKRLIIKAVLQKI